MSQKIILFLSGLSAKATEQVYLCPDGSAVTGLQTNEAPVKYLLRKYLGIREILCIVTPEAEQSAWERFSSVIRGTSAGAVLTKIPFAEGDDFTVGALSQIMSGLNRRDEIFLETTGGFRNAVMHLLLLSRILSYKGIRTVEAVYSNYNVTPKRIEDVSHLLRLFDLVGGMQELTNLGSVRTLREYYASQTPDPAIDRLLTAMEQLTEAITLCRTSTLRARMDSFSHALEDAKDCNDPLMRQLLPVFRKKFGRKMNTTNLIRWCVDSDMLQQALTVYTERIPYEILNREDIIQMDRTAVWWPEVNKYEDPYAALFLRGFLTLCGAQTRYREDNLPQKQIKTIDELRRFLPGSAYQAKRPVESIQTICRDYLYIKSLRNITNHAGDGKEETEILHYLVRSGYPAPDTLTLDGVRQMLLDALAHLHLFQSTLPARGSDSKM